jgi:hypothetical protein
LNAGYAAALPAGTAVQALDPNFRPAYISQWNFTVEKTLGRRDSIELDYLGSAAHRLPNLSDRSQCLPGPSLFCDPATRPYPRYGLLLYADSSGNSSYESVVARVEHRMAQGFDLRVEYAFSKALTDAWQSSLSIAQITDCRSCSKGPATFDVRHRAVASLLWNLPFGRGALAGGWMLSAIVTFATGQPVPLTAPNTTGSAFINPLPNRVCDGRNGGTLWFDPSCFPVPAAGYFGNSGATVLNGPGVNQWDLALQKEAAIAREALKLQWRLEMFNAWNHAEFAQPNGNAGAGVNFGRISASLPPRLVQVALKLRW